MHNNAPPGPVELRALQDLAARVGHDLGRYLALQCRWLSPASTAEERRDAVADDLLATSRGPAGTLDALQVARPILSILTGGAPLGPGSRSLDLRGVPAVAALVAAIEALAPDIAALREDRLPDQAVDRLVERAIAASDAARICAAALREIASDHG